ncbi:hypothetical protein EVJ58_g6150 [Rhodofomes roseus]|uniref:Uncharacterized protein n=1 Tax=Rhodofomes roseus TaxID=34475 RepID=A0A4Y9YAC2_9APHY|nr:hypothetical protein EVJ58_g6150 [Rhodofomes roseus]
MVGTLTFSDFLVLHSAGFIGLPDYVPDWIDEVVLQGLDNTFASLVNSPFNWEAIGNIAFHVLTNDDFMQVCNNWIAEQGGEVQLPPWIEEFREWQYPDTNADSNSPSHDPTLHHQLVVLGLWNDCNTLTDQESKWTCSPWMVLSFGQYLDLSVDHQPDDSLAEWLAEHPNVECFPHAWCTSEDGERSVGNAEDLIDNG